MNKSRQAYRKPQFRRDHQFEAAINQLKAAHKKMTEGVSRSNCLVPQHGLVPCLCRPTECHTVQEEILSNMAKDGHVNTFPKDILGMTNRLIREDGENVRAFFDHGRWLPESVGIHDASVRYLACNPHDREAFGPIERKKSGVCTHPLDASKLTDEQYGLLAYRTLMFYLGELKRLEQVVSALTAQQRQDKRMVLHRARLLEKRKTLCAYKKSFDECYLQRDFSSLVETPIDLSIRLPLEVSAADLFGLENDSRRAEVFLTIVPNQSGREGNGYFEHRVIVSRLRTEALKTESTVAAVDSLLEGVGVSDAGTSEFLTKLLSSARNAFFSRDYEQRLSEETRIAIEDEVCKSVVGELERLFPNILSAY